MDNRKRIIFILSNWGDAHQLNRVLMTKNEGFSFSVYTYLRECYPTNVDINYEVIASIEHNNYVKRIVAYLKAFWFLLKKHDNNNIYYVFGLDNVFLVHWVRFFKGKNTPVFFEVPDIRDSQTSTRLPGKIVRWIDKKLIRNIDYLIVTSKAFITGYYNDFLNLNPKFILLENKVHDNLIEFAPSNQLLKFDERAKTNSIKIGYFGLMRCRRTLEILYELVSQTDDFLIIARGIFLGDAIGFKDEFINHPRVFFKGPYVSPTDLSVMYNEIDISWIAYPFSTKEKGNWRWARTNRYYEAGFFQMPMIASIGTEDGKKVEEHGYGFPVDLNSIPSSVKLLRETINNDNLSKWKANIEGDPVGNFSIRNDYDFLFEKIKEI